LDSTINEVYSDFKDMLSKIDFKSYNPNSPEFISALNIGLMWHLLGEIHGNNPEMKMITMNEESKDEISDELFGAKKYFQKYMDSGDSSYMEMAKDELKHAEILIKKANARLPSGEEKVRLKEYEAEVKEISEQMNG